VLIAVAIVAYAVVGLLGLQAKNIKTIARGQNTTRATLLARRLLSEIQYGILRDGLDSLGNETGRFDDYPGFRWEREVIGTGLEEMREIVVRVSWDDRTPPYELIYFVRDPAL